VYVPVVAALNSERRPSYLKMDEGSMWHTSALQVAAVESATLPSRLKGVENGSFRSVEEIVNRGGQRKIWGLEMSVEGAGEANGHAPVDDGKSDEEQLASFDMDLFSSNSEGRSQPKKNSVFSRAQVRRGSSAPIENDEDARARGWYGGPIVEK
jgi:hypothetical protein